MPNESRHIRKHMPGGRRFFARMITVRPNSRSKTLKYFTTLSYDISETHSSGIDCLIPMKIF
jgi:hypothetical protein